MALQDDIAQFPVAEWLRVGPRHRRDSAVSRRWLQDNVTAAARPSVRSRQGAADPRGPAAAVRGSVGLPAAALRRRPSAAGDGGSLVPEAARAELHAPQQSAIAAIAAISRNKPQHWLPRVRSACGSQARRDYIGLIRIGLIVSVIISGGLG